VTFARQKRLLLGMLALLAPIPLPFSDVIAWPVLLVYELGVLLFLRRASRNPAGWLPLWALNVLGLIYLPVLVADLLVFHRGHLVAPVLHLGLFALLTKLFSLVRERDKWQLVIGIFFIFLASMGTSVHPTIVLYLGAFLVLSLVLMMRFAFFHVLADFSRDDPRFADLPLGRLVAGSTVFVLLLSVPLFALLPRVRAPFIVGRGGGSGAVQEAGGFSDAVSLDSIDQIRTSRAVVIRVQFEGAARPQDSDPEIRFKAASYDRYEGGRWQRTPERGQVTRLGAGFVVAPGPPRRWLHVWLQPLHSRSLPLPMETTIVEPRVSSLTVDQAGAVSFPFIQFETREYRVGAGARPVLFGAPPAGGAADPTLDLAGLTPRMAALAAKVAGKGPAAQRAARLEHHLSSTYAYTLNLGGRANDENPIDSFLFRYHSGQCEYFASAMVLMLRSQGIPARLITGFLGGELNPFEGYLILRDSNAHAWVEAYLGGRDGWRVYDPTPPAGRPAEGGTGVWLLARQAWDFVQFRWDRYVLTYGIYDQLAFFGQLRGLWHNLVGMFAPSHDESETAAVVNATTGLPVAGPAAEPWTQRWRHWRAWRQLLLSPWFWLSVVLAAAVATYVWRRLNPPLDALLAYRRLRRLLARAGLPIAPSLPPLALHAQAILGFPAAAPAIRSIVSLYLQASFGGRTLDPAELAALRDALREASAAIRSSAPLAATSTSAPGASRASSAPGAPGNRRAA
jgi:transglutaminase-like putative cysteine protease